MSSRLIPPQAGVYWLDPVAVRRIPRKRKNNWPRCETCGKETMESRCVDSTLGIYECHKCEKARVNPPRERRSSMPKEKRPVETTFKAIGGGRVDFFEETDPAKLVVGEPWHWRVTVKGRVIADSADDAYTSLAKAKQGFRSVQRTLAKLADKIK